LFVAADPLRPLDTCDGAAYHDLAVSFGNGHGLTIDDPTLNQTCRGQIPVGPSHHYAPGLPVIEGAFVALLGDTPAALAIPLVALSWGAVVVAWWAARNLYGADAGLLAGAAVSVEWTGTWFGTWFGYSENLVLITLTLTIWAVLRGLRDDRYWVLAGIFAGIGYLSKSSLGWFFLIAGIAGVGYRVIFRGWGILKNRWYWTAVGFFAVPVGIWTLRNISLFWDGTLLGLADAWQTSEVQSRLIANALAQPAILLQGLVGKGLVLGAFLTLPFLPLLPAFRPALRKWKQEDVFGLWMTAALIFALGTFFAATFWVTDQTSLLWADAARYVMPAQIPLLWLIVREGRASTAGWTTSFLILIAMDVVSPTSIFRA
jgi:4-amino-4-deoxy-L-arabinose transferase-like glycosyltransferase